MMLEITLFIACGLVGSALLRWMWTIEFCGSFWCVTPGGIILCVLGALLGPITLLTGFGMMLEHWQWSREIGRWLTTPICKRARP